MVSAEIGAPSGQDGLDFAPLEPGAELRLQTFGQGGTHLFLGVRCRGFGSRAFVTFALKNLATLAEVVAPAPARPQLLFCGDDSNCDLVPVTVMTSGLFELDSERDGVPMEVSVEVKSQAGAVASAAQAGVISTADL